MGIPPGRTCPNRGAGEQQRWVESGREPGVRVCPGPAAKQADEGPRPQGSPHPEPPALPWL